MVALVVSAILWIIVSLNNTYEWTLRIPLRVDLRPGQALEQPIPRTLDLTVRTDGWSLMSLLVAQRPVAIIRSTLRGPSAGVLRLDRADLLHSVQSPIDYGHLINVSPDSIVVTVGAVSSRRVPLLAEATIETKPGFQVVGALRVSPDSIVLTGSTRVLPRIGQWSTEPIHLADIYQPINQLVKVSDSMQGVIAPNVRFARVFADVQEIAERTFPDIPVINRSTVSDSRLRLVLRPSRVAVLIRGGARDLSELSPTELRAYVDIVEGADTSGVIQPRIFTPPGTDFTVAAVYPKHLRYIWRREER